MRKQKERTEKEKFTLKAFGIFAKLYRQSQGLTLAERGAECGITAMQQHRFEKGLVSDYFLIKKELCPEGLDYVEKICDAGVISERELIYKLSEVFYED